MPWYMSQAIYFKMKPVHTHIQ